MVEYPAKLKKVGFFMRSVGCKKAFFLHRLMVFDSLLAAFWGSHMQNKFTCFVLSGAKTCTGSWFLNRQSLYDLMCSNMHIRRLGLKTCTGSWFLLPLVQCWLNLDVLGSGNSCTGSWFLHSASPHYTMMISSASDRNLHRHMVFASSGSAR